MKTMFAFLALASLAAFFGCERRPGIRTSQTGGGPGNAPSSERSPQPGAATNSPTP